MQSGRLVLHTREGKKKETPRSFAWGPTAFIPHELPGQCRLSGNHNCFLNWCWLNIAFYQVIADAEFMKLLNTHSWEEEIGHCVSACGAQPSSAALRSRRLPDWCVVRLVAQTHLLSVCFFSCFPKWYLLQRKDYACICMLWIRIIKQKLTDLPPIYVMILSN